MMGDFDCIRLIKWVGRVALESYKQSNGCNLIRLLWGQMVDMDKLSRSLAIAIAGSDGICGTKEQK